MLTPDIVSYSDLEKRRTQNRLAKRRSREVHLLRALRNPQLTTRRATAKPEPAE